MNYKDVLTKCVSYFNGEGSPSVEGVLFLAAQLEDRTRPTRPFVKIRLVTQRDPRGHGANPRAGMTYDGNGDPTGWELHLYHNATLTFQVAAETADDRDTLLSEIVAELSRFENRPELFHNDSGDWKVGEPNWDTRTVLEDLAPQDGFSGSVRAQFSYLTRTYDTADPLLAVENNIDFE